MRTSRTLAAAVLLVLLSALAIPASAGEKTKPDRALVRALRVAVERAATAEKEENRAAARAKLEEAPRWERAIALCESLAHGLERVRLYAAQDLVARGERSAVPYLVRAAVTESNKNARVELFRAIRQLGPEGAGPLFVPYLQEKHTARRARALLGLGVFPDARAVPALVEHLRVTAAGFGTVYFAQITQRAVIADWEVASGGVPGNVVEVADPIIETFQTGTVMEVKVKRAEIELIVAVLQKITGEEIGADVDAWQRYVAARPK